MELAGVELSSHDLDNILTPSQFNDKYFSVSDRSKVLTELDGTYFWLTGIRMSNGNAIQRNQRPVEVILVNQLDRVTFHPISKSGRPLKKRIELYDNAGNGLYICETKLQAQYMYNKDLIKAVADMNYRIKEIESVKDRLVSLEQNLDNSI